MIQQWYQLFLIEKTSIGLAFFRIAIALTVGLHVLPTFMHLDENFYQSALISLNGSFFPVVILEFVAKAPDWFVLVCAWGFVITWLMFLIGWMTQLAGIGLTVLCYFFYAKNSFYIGTLSWDILLVTLTLMCVTSYPGDYFSIDYLNNPKQQTYRRARPFFIQRLLQIQIASTYFYTALSKIASEGNWITGNPFYNLMNYPHAGVIKDFMFKEWLASHPRICYAIGLMIVIIELLMPVLLWCRRTRYQAIVLGFIFHVLLLLTMDVPTIFFFLFPAQLMLFINPNVIDELINARQSVNKIKPSVKIFIDGQCGFCLRSAGLLQKMDLWSQVEIINVHDQERMAQYPQLNTHTLLKAMHLLESTQRITSGFDAFRRLCWYLPMLYPLLSIVYLPGAQFFGRSVYNFIATYRLNLMPLSCESGTCKR